LGFQADIYPLGLIFLELLIPFGSRSELSDVVRKLKDSDSGDKSVKLKMRTQKLIRSMLSTDPKERPEAMEILDNFDQHF
jgi:hypothetical protein